MILLEIEIGCKGDYAAKVNLIMPHVIGNDYNRGHKKAYKSMIISVLTDIILDIYNILRHI
jgi:hypothetical protein